VAVAAAYVFPVVVGNAMEVVVMAPHVATVMVLPVAVLTEI